MKITNLLISALALISFTLSAQINLRVNYETTPLGTDIASPQFSWQMKAISNRKGQMQTAYQIVVKDPQNQEVWNSQKVASDLSHAIQYAGQSLKPTTRYQWTVTVWDEANKPTTAASWFETGLMNPKIDAWSGAQWIGGGNDDLNFYSHYLSVFKLEYAVQLTGTSTKASFVYGANDSRLANPYLNFMGVEKGRNQSYIEVELDCSKLTADTSSRAFLNIYRVGYTKADSDTQPLKSIAISSSIINDSNKNLLHTIYLESNLGLTEFYIDGTTATNRIQDPSMRPVGRFGSSGLNLNPVGLGGNYISFPMLGDIGFKTKEGQTAQFSNIVVKNYRAPGNAIFTEKSLFKNLPKANGAYQVAASQLMIENPSQNATPMLRTVFSSSASPIKKARLYATARGVYEIYLNGQRVSNEYFNPGLTQYNKHHMYQTFDVTDKVKSGQNALSAWLSEGWWSGHITYSGEHWNWFGDRQSLLAKLVITYADGTEQVITSNDKDWKLFTDGPVRVGSFFQGEVYDATKEASVNGWNTVSYNDSKWKNAVEVPLEGTSVVGEMKYGNRTANIPYNDFNLVGQMGENIKIVKTLTAKKVAEVRPKVFLYDLGQNITGIPKIQIRNGKKGQVVTLRFAEITYPNLPEYKGNEGMIMLENIRAALAQDQFILKGGDEVLQPRFTFHGFKYIEITGIDKALPINDVKGLAISSISSLVSDFKTNDPAVNKLWENITWSLRDNFVSIPTDCPQRNERMGWSGDISVFSRSATYLTDANLFLRRHLMAMRDIQAANGRYTDVAPVGGGFGGTLWGSAGIVVAWETYRQYGDIQLLAEHYESMKQYLAFLETKIDKATGVLNEGPLGDWLSPENNKNDNTELWTAYLAYDYEIVAKMAEALGKKEDAKILFDKSEATKKLFSEVYLEANTAKTVKSGLKTGFMPAPNEADTRTNSDKGQLIDTQASYAIPLALGTLKGPEKEAAFKNLVATITRKNKDDGGVERPEFSLMTGFIGTAAINEALSENGRDDIAYKLLVNKQYPSWLYSVVNGSTTIWERLNSYTVENGFGGNNGMNSFNHYSFGAVAAWMYNYALGIQRHPTVPAFKEFILKPSIDLSGSITHVSGYVDTMYGRIKSSWKMDKGNLTYTCTVPPNTKATLYLPSNTEINTPTFRTENGKMVMDLKSGTQVVKIKVKK